MQPFSVTQFQAELKPTADPKSTSGLDLSGGIQSVTTDVYLEHTQALEFSTDMESNIPSSVEETTEKATGDYSEQPRTGAPVEPTHPWKATTSSQCLFKIRDQ